MCDYHHRSLFWKLYHALRSYSGPSATIGVSVPQFSLSDDDDDGKPRPKLEKRIDWLSGCAFKTKTKFKRGVINLRPLIRNRSC